MKHPLSEVRCRFQQNPSYCRSGETAAKHFVKILGLVFALFLPGISRRHLMSRSPPNSPCWPRHFRRRQHIINSAWDGNRGQAVPVARQHAVRRAPIFPPQTSFSFSHHHRKVCPLTGTRTKRFVRVPDSHFIWHEINTTEVKVTDTAVARQTGCGLDSLCKFPLKLRAN